MVVFLKTKRRRSKWESLKCVTGVLLSLTLCFYINSRSIDRVKDEYVEHGIVPNNASSNKNVSVSINHGMLDPNKRREDLTMTNGVTDQVNSTEVGDVMNAFNTTKNVPYLVYNRVPKCGSRTLNQLIQTMSILNKFTFNQSKNYNALSTKSEEFVNRFVNKSISILKKIGQNNKTIGGTAYERHMFYINLTSHLESKPKLQDDIQPTSLGVNWINMIRNPIDRYESYYYFMNKNSRNKIPHLGECVTKSSYQRSRECPHAGYSSQMEYFAYRQFRANKTTRKTPSVVFDGKEGLKIAKNVITQDYPVVGVTELYMESMKVFEAYIPRFFKNVTAIYKAKYDLSLESGEHEKGENVNEYEKMNSTLREILERGMFKYDVMFYEFVKSRLLQQLNQI